LVAVIVPELVPSGVDTVTTTDPVDAAAGAIARMMLDVLTYQPVGAGVDPKSTAVAPSKSPPVISTKVPPPRGPWEGETEFTTGTVDVALAIPGTPAVTKPTARRVPSKRTPIRLFI